MVTAAAGIAGLWRKDKELWTGERLGAHIASAAHLGQVTHLSEVVLIFHASPLPSAHPKSLTRPSASPFPGCPGQAPLHPVLSLRPALTLFFHYILTWASSLLS